MPTVAQIRIIGPDAGSTTYVDSFSPVLGGTYDNGVPGNIATRGLWWGSEASSSAGRHVLDYRSSDGNLYNPTGSRKYGYYIRCVSEEKDVQDLTYMQDMTPSIAASP